MRYLARLHVLMMINGLLSGGHSHVHSVRPLS